MNIRAINGERYIITQWVNPNPAINDSNWHNPTGSPLDINGTWNISHAVVAHRAHAARRGPQGPVPGRVRRSAATTSSRKAWSVGVRFVDRELKRVIEDFGIFTDPSDPPLLTGYVIGNPGEGNFGAPYEQAEAVLPRRRAHPAAGEGRPLAALQLVRLRQGQGQLRGPLHLRLRPARPEHHGALRHPLVPPERLRYCCARTSRTSSRSTAPTRSRSA